jgi:hypothetical protein
VLPLFSSEVLGLNPLYFRIAFFSSEVFDLSPLHFKVVYFSSEVFGLSPFGLLGVIAFINYGDSVASDFDKN